VIVAIHQPNFLPWLGFFHKMLVADCFVFLDDVSFSKGSFTNRVKIKTARGAEWLTVPVLTKGKSGQPISEVRCSSTVSWLAKLRKTLQLNYSSCPFWSLYEEIFYGVAASCGGHLGALNTGLITQLATLLGIHTSVFTSCELAPTGTGTARLISICQELGADVYLSGSGGRSYQEEEEFSQQGIELRYDNFEHPVYSQQFGEFIPGLSVIDLLANYGPASGRVLECASST